MSILSIGVYLDNFSAVKLSAVSKEARIILGNDSLFKKRYENQNLSFLGFAKLQDVVPESCWKIACCLYSHGYFLDRCSVKQYVSPLIEKYKAAIKNDLHDLGIDPHSKIQWAWESYVASPDSTKAFEYNRYLRLENRKVELESELVDLEKMDERTAIDQVFKKLVIEKDAVLKYRFPLLIEDLYAAQKKGGCIEPIVERIRMLINSHSQSDTIWRDLYDLCGEGSEEADWSAKHFVKHLHELSFIFRQNTWR